MRLPPSARHRLPVRLLGPIALLTVIATGVLTIGAAVYCGRQAEQTARTALRHRLGIEVNWLAKSVAPHLAARAAAAESEHKPNGTLQDAVAALPRSPATRFSVIAPKGEVLADTHADPATLDSHEARPELFPASDRTHGHARRHSQTLGAIQLYVARRIETLDRAGEPLLLGYARVASGEFAVNEASSAARTPLLLLGSAVLGLCLAGWLWTAYRTTTRLRTLTATAEGIADGDLDQRVRTSGDDVVGQLGRAIDEMAEQLSRRLDSTSQDRNEVLAIISSMVEGVIAVDGDQRIVQINEAATVMLGISGSPTGQRIWEVTRHNKIRDILERTVDERRATNSDLTLPGRAGDHHLELYCTPLRDGHSEVVGAVLVLHDISQLRRLEQVRRDFVTNVSHELKTPLTSIRGYVETLLDDDDTPPAVRQRFLKRIAEQSHRLSTLVSDLLVLSRVESQGKFLERSRVDLRDPVQASVGLLQSRAEQKGLELTVEVPDDPVWLEGDAEALRQVVDNLLSNAIQYTPADGQVWLELRHVDNRALVHIRDTGVGLEARHLGRIFERFYRVDKARSKELGGTGLGLAIVKHITLAHGGDVSVESTAGVGSTFSVELPTVSRGAAAAEHEVAIDEPMTRTNPDDPIQAS